MRALARAIGIRLLLGAVLLFPGLSASAQDGVRHLFYEAVATGSSGSPYEVRRRLTEAVQAEILPAVLSVMQVPPGAVHTELRMGGYLRETNPALHSAVRLTDQAADRLALALGWTLAQESVLVSDLAEQNGTGTGYAVITFADRTLTPDLAQRFFLAAAAVHQGLGGGYTAFGDRLLFLNLRGPDGTPYSGLPDGEFVAALGKAANGFPGAALAGNGASAARLVESTTAQRDLSDAVLGHLRPLRDRHAALSAQLLSSSTGKTTP